MTYARRFSRRSVSPVVFLIVGALLASCGSEDGDVDHGACAAPPGVDEDLAPLPHFSARIARGGPVTIVALGSSSTEGIGASEPSRSYPSRLRSELAERLPGIAVEVLNRGVGGDTTAAMLARIERDAIAPRPDLVIWQVGSNDVLGDEDPVAVGMAIREGIARLRGVGTDVVLMDVQYAPAILEHEGYRAIEDAIARVARADGVPVFRRFDTMRQWDGSGALPAGALLYRDHLHMNDLGYRCIARLLAEDIVTAAR